ncbi:hypothetical protein [Paludibacterium denitrificans]|uniref:Uncharacterized protein n=1 Tax=Paludibacterium denitrificans TaxID=2675226 RepID=A0A844GD53_9NEIS|nr:hypothetical protein [Paludibacterium denitrificans]MTD32857.1 hypothetical protein [Paludibacterium denitrificans]
MKKTATLLTPIILFILIWLLFYHGGKSADVFKMENGDFLLIYNRRATIYTVGFRELSSGNNVAALQTEANNQHYKYPNRKTLVRVRHLQRFIKKGVPYVALIGSDNGYIVATFCESTQGILNRQEGWLTESEENFTKRCAAKQLVSH